MKRKSWNYLTQGLLLWLCLFSYEFLFYLLNMQSLQGFPLVRIVFFTGMFTFILQGIGYLMSFRFQFGFKSLIFLILSFYGFTQISYLRQMQQNYALSLLISMFTRVQDYAGDFASNLTLIDFLVFVPWILFVTLMSLFAKRVHHRHIGSFSMGLIAFLSFGIITLFDQEILFYRPHQHQAFPSTQVGLAELGSLQFVLIGWMQDENQQTDFELISDDWPTIADIIKEATNTERTINNEEFMSKVESEENEVMREIDHYFLQRPLTDRNAMTGYLKDKNLILFLVEALDYMAIDATLTPTLYEMMNEGWNFTQHYTPQYSCATGESEWVALNSLIPSSTECTPNAYQDNTFPYSIFNLFNKDGYDVNSFHNYSDKFYDRALIHKNLGSTFYNNAQLDIPTLKGWPSDVDLITQAYPIMTESNRFMSFIITSSTHFPYDIDSTLGNRYLDQINQVHPDYPIEVKRYLSKAMELDKALATLIQQLKDDDLLKDTLIVLFADHFPFRMDKENFLNYGDPFQQRGTGLNIFQSPFIMYGAGIESKRIETISSTYSILPTLANLFGLPYDPRLAIGQDLFDGTMDHVAFLESLSWVSDQGYYSRIQKRFYPKGELDEEYVERINATLELDQSFALRILKQNYFALR